MSGVSTPARPLLGRGDDLAWVEEFVDRTTISGGSGLLVGDAGIGKSTLLDAAVAAGYRRNLRVLRAEGVEFESDLSYAALNQLLRPVLDGLDGLEPLLGEALAVALGLRPGAEPPPLTVANGALALLSRGDAAVLLVVDDVQWVDQASAVVLGMVARRTVGTRIGLVMAARSGHPTLLSSVVAQERVVGPLPAAEARDLVRQEQPGVSYSARERLVAVSEGNPLALIELGVAVASDPDATVVSGPTLPLTRRLRRVYADRLGRLPEQTRKLLLVAALEPACDGSVLRSISRGADVVAELAPAVQDGLVAIGRTATVRFAHPLVRSAVVDMAGPDERARTHRLLAETLVDDPIRRVWHLGQASTGPDEELAVLLDQAAPEVFDRGDSGAAIAAMIRAADLSSTSASRARRLAKAAWFGVIRTGDGAAAERLLGAAQEADAAAAATLFAAAVLPYLAIRGRVDVDAIHALLIKLYQETDFAEGPIEIREVLTSHQTFAIYTARTDIWNSHTAALRRLGARARTRTRDVLVSTFDRGPVAPKLAMLPYLDEAVAGLGGSDDIHHIMNVGTAATQLDQLDRCRPALERIVEQYGGEDGTNVPVAVAAFLLGTNALDHGDWTRADRIIGDARARIGTDNLVGWLLDYADGVLAARRGRSAEVERTCGALSEWSFAARIVHIHHDLVRAAEALARAEWSRAFALLRGVMPAEDPFGESPVVPLLTLDFAEAAWRSGHFVEARAHVAVMDEAGCARLASRAALVLAGAQAVVADDDAEATGLFERALAGPGADRWPFERARIQLAYGRRLRRGRDPRAARAPLAAARSGFEHLGAVPWVEQAAVELRAAGQVVVRHGSQSARLTAQELTIAGLAARGLSNKEIAARLSLSPRTVSTHLYRIFPKLGVSSRAGLRDAIDDSAPVGVAPDEPA